MKEVKIGTYFKGDESFNFEFYTDLTIFNKLKFVNSVVDLLVDGNNYNYIIKELLFDFYLIDIMTDIDTTELKTSNFFINDVEEFLEETNVVDIIKANVADGLIEELNNAINLNVEYKTGIHPSPLNEALSKLVNTLENKLSSFDMDSVMEMATKFSGMTGEFTPENVVNAYLNSDVHKQNIVEIAEVKKKREDIVQKLDEAVKTVDGSKFSEDNKTTKTTKTKSAKTVKK